MTCPRDLASPHRDSGFRSLRRQQTHVPKIPDHRSPMPPVIHFPQGRTFRHLSLLNGKLVGPVAFRDFATSLVVNLCPHRLPISDASFPRVIALPATPRSMRPILMRPLPYGSPSGFRSSSCNNLNFTMSFSVYPWSNEGLKF
jgi:hypothetical protein